MNLDPETLKKILALLKEEDGEGALKLLEDLATGAPSGEPAPADPTGASSDPKPEDEAMAAASRALVELTSCKTVGEAVQVVRDVFAERAKRIKDAGVLEASERRSLVAELVSLDVETPASAWTRDDKGEIPSGDARVPVKRLADEPIADLRSRVADIAKRRGKSRPQTPPTRSSTDGPTPEEGGRAFKTSKGEITLTAREIKNCETQGAKLEDYAENKAVREAARSGRK